MSSFQYMSKTPGDIWSRSSFQQSVNSLYKQYDKDNDGLDRQEFGHFVNDTWQNHARQISEVEKDRVFINFSGVPTQGNAADDTDFATLSKVEMGTMLIAMDSQEFPPFSGARTNTASNGIVEQDEFIRLTLPSPPNFSPIDTYLTAHQAVKDFTEPAFGENPEAAIVEARNNERSTDQLPVNAQTLPQVSPENRATAQEILQWQGRYNERQIARLQNNAPATLGTADKPFLQFLPPNLSEALQNLFIQ